jgi:hyperosmotically inducible periplasmic protein
MMRRLTIPPLILAMGLSAGCASARRAGSATKDTTVAAGREVGHKTEDVAEKVADKTSDATITAAVKAKFAKDKTVDASNIDVDTKNNNVTLNGTVKSQAEADQAVALARSVEGVKDVTPRLTVQSR